MINQKHLILAERVKTLYKHAPRIIPFNLVIFSVVIGVIWNQVPKSLLIGGWLIFLIITIARFIHVKYEIRRNIWKTRIKTLIIGFCVGSLAIGIAWGLAFVVYANYLNTLGRFFILLTIGGVSAGAITSMSTIQTAYISYMAPMMFAPILWFLIFDPIAAIPIIIVIVFFIFALILSYIRSFEIAKETIILRYEKDALIASLSKANAKIKQISLTDELTQVGNRRYFAKTLQEEWNRAKRLEAPISLIILDIDYFKSYNDKYGHIQGDKCLRQVAHLLEQDVKRSGDVLIRYGGEEFAIILPNVDEEGAVNLAKIIQKNLDEADIRHEGSTVSNKLTVSFGIATLVPHKNDHSEMLIKGADKALYLAKTEGRNRYVVYRQE